MQWSGARTGREPPAGGRSRARRLPAEERRSQLLDVAAELLVEEGPRALTMEGVAERAVVSKGLGYAYFRDAEELAFALWDREVAEVYRRVEGASRAAPSFEDRLRGAVGAYFDVVAERGALLGVLEAHLSRSRAARRSRRRIRDFLRFWSRQIQQVHPVSLPVASALAGMLLSAADACGRSWRAGLLGREQAERICVDFLIAGLRDALPAGALRRRSRPS